MKRILGVVSEQVVKQWGLQEQSNKKIVIYPEAKEHAKERHMEEYEKIDDYYYVMDSLEQIIQYPDYVFYDEKKHGLEYYKTLGTNVMVAVRVEKGRELKVKSVYPVSQLKIKNRKKKEEQEKLNILLEKYRYKG